MVNPEEKVTNPPEAHQPVDPEEKSANLSEPVNPQEKSEHLQDTVKLAHPEDKLANLSEAVHLTDYAEAPANSVEQQPIVPAEQKPAINEAKAEDSEVKFLKTISLRNIFKWFGVWWCKSSNQIF